MSQSATGGEAPVSPGTPSYERLITLPMGRMLAGVVAVAAGVVVVGWPVAAIFQPRSVQGVILGGVGPAFVVGLGVVACRPWRARKVVQWPMTLFAVQGASLLGVGALAVGVYTMNKPEPIAFALAVFASFAGSWVVVAKVVAGALGRGPGAPPA